MLYPGVCLQDRAYPVRTHPTVPLALLVPSMFRRDSLVSLLIKKSVRLLRLLRTIINKFVLENY